MKDRLIRRVSLFALPSSLVFWIAIQVPIFLFINFLYNHRPIADPSSINSDVRAAFDAATSLSHGLVPYRDFFFPYPPLALLFFLVPRVLATDLGGYFGWFNFELLLLSCAGLAATATIARRIGQSIGATLLVYSISLIAVGAIVPQRYDLAPAVIVILALAARVNGKFGIAYSILAIGMLTKVYPALILPLFLIADCRRGGASASVRGALIFAIVSLIGLLPILLLSPAEAVAIFRGQAGRDVGLNSVYGSLLLASRALGVPAQVVYDRNLNAWNVTLPNAPSIALAATILQLTALALIYLRFLVTKGEPISTLVRYSAAVIAAALMTSKVFSPQFVIWLIPISFLIGGRRFIWASALFVFAALLTQWLYPFQWPLVRQGASLAVVIALARDICIIGLCFILLRQDRKSIPSYSESRIEPQPAAHILGINS